MVDPASILRIEGDMAALGGHADTIAAAGAGFAATGESVHAIWQGLAAVYVAPEAGELFAATLPVVSVSATVGEDMTSAAAVLCDYATEVAGIQARLDVLRAQATALVAAVAAVRDESTFTTLQGQDGELAGAVGVEVAAWEAAQIRCANALRGLYGAAPLVSAGRSGGPLEVVVAGGVGVPLTFDDPVANGMPATSGFAADPVCTATGHFVEVEVDLGAPSTAGVLAWTRVYGSRHARSGPLGRGWSSWASARLERVAGGVGFIGPDGRRAVFAPAVGDSYARVAGIAGLLSDHPDGGWVLDWFAGDTWRFDSAGHPVAVHDGGGAGTTVLVWSGSRLVVMLAPTGRRVDLDWSGDRIVGVRTGDGRAVRYRYNAAGDLVGAEGPGGARRYRVDERGLVAAVTDADGVDLVTNSYDAHGRVVGQVSPFGRCTRFTYRPDRSTVVDDDGGGPRTTYFHDGDGRLIGLVDDHGSRMVKYYDRWGNPVAIADRAGAVVAQEFDERGNLLRRVEPDGAVMVQDFDGLDRLVRRTDPTGAVVELRYTGRDRAPSTVIDSLGARTHLEVLAGEVMRIVDPDGVETRFDRDRDGRIVAATDGAGATTRFGYDRAGLLAAVTGPDGAVTTVDRDDAGRVVARRDPVGAITTFDWSPAGRELGRTNPVGGVTRREFGVHGEAVAITDPAGGTSRVEWDSLGRMVWLTNPHGAKLEHRHDGLGRLVAVDDPAGGTTLREYDAEGRLLAVVDAAGRRRERVLDVRGRTVAESDGVGTVRYAYDAAGRRISSVDAEGGTLTVSYDPAGRPVTATDPEGGVTGYEWSPGGRLRRRVSPMGRVTSWEYDAAGRAVVEIGPDGGRREVERDASGRVIAARTPGGLISQVRHDAVGRPVARRDPHGGVTGFVYDPAGRLTAMTGPDGASTRYEWNPAGQLTAVIDPLGATTGFAYDPAGQLSAATDPLGGQQVHHYDEVGRLTGFTDQRGATTTFDLDPTGRVLSRTDPTGAVLRLSYDDAGRAREWKSGGLGARVDRDATGGPVRFVETSGRVTEWHHDRNGRPTRWVCEDAELSWMWDGDGRRTAVVHPDGSTTRYGHDEAGNLVTVEHPMVGRTRIDRDADGRPLRLTGPGHERRWTWRAGRLARWESDGAAVDLRYDPAGRVVTELTPDGRREYRYDAAGRLIAWGQPDGTITTWTYDAAGNRTAERGPASERRFRHDAGHRLVAIDSPAGTTTLTWDDAGRRTGERHPDGSATTYRWDTLGRLSGITRPDGSTVDLDVDARGDLRAVNGTPLVWDPADTIPRARQVGDTQIVGAATPLAAVPADGAPSMIRPDVHLDVCGTSTVPGPAGTVVNRADHGGRDPWGQPTTTTTTTTTTTAALGYRGELEFAGLVWLRHRVYDPATAAFLSPDPLPPLPGSAAMNPYAYAGNDPVGAIDPLGLQPMTDADAQQMRDTQDKPWWEDAWDWAGDHLDEIGAGALAVGGAALLFTPLAPIGAGILIGMAASAGIQAVTTGEIDARQLWISGLAGGISGGVGAGAGLLTAGTSTAIRVTAQAGAGAVAESGISAGTQYVTTGQVDPGRVLLDGTVGAVAGGAGPALGDAGQAAINRLRGGPSSLPVAPATPVVEATGSDLSAFGNRAGPRAPRAGDMEVGPDGMLVPQAPPAPTGASTFADPAQAPLSGHYHTIPAGTTMPPGLAVVRDGIDVGGQQPATHATIYTTEAMTPEAFGERFQGLPWEYGGKK